MDGLNQNSHNFLVYFYVKTIRSGECEFYCCPALVKNVSVIKQAKTAVGRLNVLCKDR